MKRFSNYNLNERFVMCQMGMDKNIRQLNRQISEVQKTLRDANNFVFNNFENISMKQTFDNTEYVTPKHGSISSKYTHERHQSRTSKKKNLTRHSIDYKPKDNNQKSMSKRVSFDLRVTELCKMNSSIDLHVTDQIQRETKEYPLENHLIKKNDTLKRFIQKRRINHDLHPSIYAEVFRTIKQETDDWLSITSAPCSSSSSSSTSSSSLQYFDCNKTSKTVKETKQSSKINQDNSSKTSFKDSINSSIDTRRNSPYIKNNEIPNNTFDSFFDRELEEINVNSYLETFTSTRK